MNQVNLTTLTDAALRSNTMLYTTKIEKAMQIVSDAEAALAKIDDEFVRRNSLRAVGIKDITPNVI